MSYDARLKTAGHWCRCGSWTDYPGLCVLCELVAAPPPSNGWRCPGCNNCHAPSVETCPVCRMVRTANVNTSNLP